MCAHNFKHKVHLKRQGFQKPYTNKTRHKSTVPSTVARPNTFIPWSTLYGKMKCSKCAY